MEQDTSGAKEKNKHDKVKLKGAKPKRTKDKHTNVTPNSTMRGNTNNEKLAAPNTSTPRSPRGVWKTT